jgi:AraC-like DNA-binding protein
MTDPHVRSAAFTACLHLKAFSDCDVWCDGTRQNVIPISAGAIHINDMRHSWSADVRSGFEVVNFYIPQSALDCISDDLGAARIDDLHCPMSEAKVDDVFKHLALALLPALMVPDQANKLFVDHAWRAVTAYLARCYGSLRSPPVSARGGLAPWQERRAKEMLLADLSGSLTLPDLARACHLSCSHFSQAFRISVGCPPHQWLLLKRVERAKHLMLNTSQSLSDIALETGFSDQSHFTRVFSQRVSASPAAWRRAQER